MNGVNRPQAKSANQGSLISFLIIPLDSVDTQLRLRTFHRLCADEGIRCAVHDRADT
jgi:hypothetical protein